MTIKKAANKSKKKSAGNAWLILGAFVIMSGIVWYVISSNNDASGSNAGLVATLNPAAFDGRAREAYQVAKDIPEVLAELPCFCGCANQGHKSNLFCFKDSHGNECAMCQDIAMIARALHDQGKEVDKIRDEIISRYAQYAP
jgi:hypothetical protein